MAAVWATCLAGSIGTIVAAHPGYGYHLVEFDAPRLCGAVSRADMAPLSEPLPGVRRTTTSVKDLSRFTPAEMVAKMTTSRPRWLKSGNSMIASYSG